MRFYTGQHRFYCGVDLHARTMYLCILDHAGQQALTPPKPIYRVRSSLVANGRVLGLRAGSAREIPGDRHGSDGAQLACGALAKRRRERPARVGEFFPEDGDLRRGIHANADAAALDRQDLNRDAEAGEDDLFTGVTGENEHEGLLSKQCNHCGEEHSSLSGSFQPRDVQGATRIPLCRGDRLDKSRRGKARAFFSTERDFRAYYPSRECDQPGTTGPVLHTPHSP
jgi:hypothetical protein